jgi:hypothetical protein
MQTIIIEVSGGVVQEVYSDATDLHVVKVDWDAGDSPGDKYCVGQLIVQPMLVVPEETREAVTTLIK